MRMRASWFGSLRPTGYKVAARVPRARQRAPLGCVIPTTTSVPPCSGLSRCGLETTERAATAERRPTLTAPARAGLHHVRVGAKKRDSKSNKETGMKEVENGSNKRLTSTASYKDKLKRFGLFTQIGESRFFPTINAAVDGYLGTHEVQWSEP